MYENCKIYWPYTRKDWRKIVIIIDSWIKRTISYPKYLMELYLWRKLTEEETVDHIDCDFNNNDISNLRVIDRISHSYDDVIRRHVRAVCLFCWSNFDLTVHQKSRYNWKTWVYNASWPFCSKSCAWKVWKNKSTCSEWQSEILLDCRYRKKNI